MKYIIVSLAIVLGSLSGTQASISTTWGANVPGAYLYDFSASLLDPSGLHVELVIDVNNNTTFSDFENGYIGLSSDSNGWESWISSTATDDVAVDISNWVHVGGNVGAIQSVESSVAEQYASSRFYFRWFNSDSPATATEAGVIYGAGGSGGTSSWRIGDPNAAPPTPSDEGFLQYDTTVGNAGTAYTPGSNDGWQTIQPIPEPGTIGLMLIGAGVLAYRKRRQVQQAIQG